MASMVLDQREEMDSSLAAPSPAPTRKQAALANKLPSAETRATFLIRTLPRDCNPTPVTAAQLQPSASSTTLLSPRSTLRQAPELVLESDPSDVPDNPFDDLTDEKLRQLSGRQDLARVTTIELSVDSSRQSVEVVGELLPALHHLRLAGSSLGSFRDLGTSLQALQVLHVPHCGLRDLDGISALTALRELYAPHNEISDISPLTMHEELSVVDLESNCIVDVGQIEQLAFCPQLSSLSLVANPVCAIDRFRQIVATFVPQLVTLDRVELSGDDQRRLPDEIIDAAIRAFRDRREAEEAARRPPSSHGGRPAAEPSPHRLSGRALADAESHRDDYGSSLTHGTDIVFAGNVTSALRRRRSETEGDPDASPVSAAPAPAPAALASPPPTEPRPQTPARESITATLDRAHELDRQQHKSRDAILHELRAWRLETAGASQVGVISPAASPDRRSQSQSQSQSQRPPRPATPKAKASDKAKATERRRPQTSAGVVRGVREAFAESPSRSRAVDILVLDDGPSRAAAARSRPSSNNDGGPEDRRRPDADADAGDDVPCSPRKTARGVFSPMAASGDDDDDELLLLLPTPQSRARSRRRRDSGELEDDEHESRDGAAEQSDESDGEDLRRMARALKQRRRPPETTAAAPQQLQAEPQPPQRPFLDVTASLEAIDQWREQMDEPSRGPACGLSDEQLVAWLRDRHAELRTREAFRRFFRGISEERLARALQSVFREHQDKIRRRLQLMQGFFGSG
ncbi:hypothetical protein P43SY_005007 [Pythium insidiosum]|uniref:Uncharacterized protein n=1 Tax=Pythium insidiosum TaxID=114742 RepID=A0AAD5LRY6_PYTIN|nr:hypothetical protein P43SY_005007 [Pythium insidiosum]